MKPTVEQLTEMLSQAHTGLLRALDYRAATPEGLAIKAEIRAVLRQTGYTGNFGEIETVTTQPADAGDDASDARRYRQYLAPYWTRDNPAPARPAAPPAADAGDIHAGCKDRVIFVQRERDLLREALVKVRAHTGRLPGADLDLLNGLLDSIERITVAALK